MLRHLLRTGLLGLAGLVLTSCSTIASEQATPIASVPFSMAARKSPFPQTGKALPSTPIGIGTSMAPTSAPGSLAPSISAAAPKNGWKTLTSSGLNLVIKYPPSWSASEEENNIIFISRSGAEIQLKVLNTGSLSLKEYLTQELLPNTRCIEKTNPHGVEIFTCFDTITFSTIAFFALPAPQGRLRLFSFALPGRQDLGIFNAMLDTLHPAA
jgi:hypothetical protein